MPVILLRPQKTESSPNQRPKECPYCGSTIIQRWGRVTKPIKDKQNQNTIIYRYRCDECQRTFRDYPKGIDRSDYSRSTRQLAALIWALGFSYRDIITIFKNNGINLSRSTVWRAGKSLLSNLNGNSLENLSNRLAIDKKYIHNVSSTFGVVVAIDVGEGQYTILGTFNEYSPRAVEAWLRLLIQDAEIEVIKLATGKLELIHRAEKIEAGGHIQNLDQ